MVNSTFKIGCMRRFFKKVFNEFYSDISWRKANSNKYGMTSVETRPSPIQHHPYFTLCLEENRRSILRGYTQFIWRIMIRVKSSMNTSSGGKMSEAVDQKVVSSSHAFLTQGFMQTEVEFSSKSRILPSDFDLKEPIGLCSHRRMKDELSLKDIVFGYLFGTPWTVAMWTQLIRSPSSFVSLSSVNISISRSSFARPGEIASVRLIDKGSSS